MSQPIFTTWCLILAGGYLASLTPIPASARNPRVFTWSGSDRLSTSTRPLIQATSHCTRPDYVFLQCKQPEPSVDRIISISYNSSFDQLQQQCHNQPSCVAFSTDGTLVKADAKTVKAGPFKCMSNCGRTHYLLHILPRTARTASYADCKGTYVRDQLAGKLISRQWRALRAIMRHVMSVDSNPGLAAVVSRSNATTASSQHSQLAGTYVRGQSGEGSLGRGNCALC